MKKLGKLNINSEKIMKNEELMTLRGGYDGCANMWCMCYMNPDNWFQCYCSLEAMQYDLADRCRAGLGSCANVGSCF